MISSRDEASWVKTGEGAPYIIRSVPLDVQADPEAVWAIVKDVERYGEFSQGAVTAHISNELSPGYPIELSLFSGRFVGHLIPDSTEDITIVDEEQKTLCWERALPFCSGRSQRFHMLETLPDNQGTRSYIALHLPGSAGFFTKKLMGGLIEDAFNALNEGIKQEAESGGIKNNS